MLDKVETFSGAPLMEASVFPVSQAEERIDISLLATHWTLGGFLPDWRFWRPAGRSEPPEKARR